MEEQEKPKKVKKPKEKLYSNNIKMILDEIGMTQVELADLAVDGNTPYLSKIINGKRRHISLPIAFKIAKALNRPVEEVFIHKRKS
jgi:hypothetical protein